MFDELRDPEPPAPTAATREAVGRRARRLARRRQAAVVSGGVAALALVVVSAAALLGGSDDPAPIATPIENEVRGARESNPSTTTEAPPATVAPEPPPPAVEAPPPPPPPPPSPAEATLNGEVVVPSGFSVTGCTVGGSPVALTGTTFVSSGLAPGTSVDVVCDAQSGDGAARAARVVVALQPGANSVRITL